MPSSVQISLPSRYRLGGHIANGGMAAVWAAEDELLGRPVAIKVLAAHLAEEPVNVQRFQREARAAARLSSHPNVVTVYDVGEHDGRAFMVMERIDGGTVADRLRRGRPTREQAVAWLRQTAAALDFAHQNGIVHRDVKPANLLLDGRDHVRVADFGIARIATEDTMTGSGQLLGTVAYLSPEVVEGDAATPASDRYGLAVVAFELLTGQRPFTGDHPAAQARQHVEEPPPRAGDREPGLSARVDVALQRGMAKDPEARWPTATAFVDALEAGLLRERARTPRTRTRPGPPRPDAGEPRRRRTPALVALGVLALVAAVVAILLGSGSGGSGGSPDRSASRSTANAPAKKKSAGAAKTPATTPTAPATSTPTTSTPAATPSTTTSSGSSGGSGAASSGGSSSATALQAQGHALIGQGQYDQAVGVLRQAISATGRSTAECIDPTGACLTYAYALFDLGHALRLAGQTDEAVAVLEDRLRIHNQTPAVQAELDAARGGSAAATPSGKVPPGQAKKAGPGGATEH